MPFKFGPWELGLILGIILIVFGGGKLARVGSDLGKTIRAFKKAQGDDSEQTQARTAENG